jgi:hypothetical protein
LRIRLKCFYRVTVNRPTTGESVPRVPRGRRRISSDRGRDRVAQVLAVTLHRRDKSPGGEVSLITRRKIPVRVMFFPG